MKKLLAITILALLIVGTITGIVFAQEIKETISEKIEQVIHITITPIPDFLNTSKAITPITKQINIDSKGTDANFEYTDYTLEDGKVGVCISMIGYDDKCEVVDSKDVETTRATLAQELVDESSTKTISQVEREKGVIIVK